MPRTRSEQWWRDAVVYQIYPRSFADADGNGVGDLAGATARLPYVAGLGVQAIWLTPFQRSPQADHGYDVSDYCDVDPLFGDLSSFDSLVRAAHDLGLLVLVDLVPNHASSAHPLFRAALAAEPGSAERALFHFAPGRGPDGAEPPNNWSSVFGGPAWTRVHGPDGTPGEWYLHLYAPEQPDWNWRDPRVGPMFDDVVRFWFDRGADGLRIDVAHGLFKAAGLPDLDAPATVEPMRLRANPLACNQVEVHEVYRRWRRIADGYEQPRVLVGEANLPALDVASYTRPDELHQVFAFAFLAAPWDAQAWHEAAVDLLDVSADTGASTTWVVENHDVVRVPTRYGGGTRGRRARRPRSSRCSACRARRTCTRARSSGCRRSTCPRPFARTPPGRATASPATGAVSPCRGRRIPLRRTGSRARGAPSRGCRCRAAGVRCPSRRRAATRPRCWRCAAAR